MPAFASPWARFDLALVFMIGVSRSLSQTAHQVHAKPLHDTPQGAHFDGVPQRRAGAVQLGHPARTHEN